MPKRHQKSSHETQSPEHLNDESAGDILSSVDQFIENVYRNLDMTPPQDAPSRHPIPFEARRSSPDPIFPPMGAASLLFSPPHDNRESVVSPSSRRNIDADVERINLMCDRVERNLRSIGVFMNPGNPSSSSEEHLSTNLSNSPTSSTTSVSVLSQDISASHATSSLRSGRARETMTIEMPRPIIDLSESRIDLELDSDDTNDNNNDGEGDDDVIVVSSNIQPVVDLCTPGDQWETSRRRRRHTANHTTLTRRRLAIPDPHNEETCMEDGPTTTRKRRMGNKRKSLDLSTTKGTTTNISSTVNISSDRSPYTCAVCLESYFQRQPTTTRCGHVFCKECIAEAVRLTHKCPMCNARVGCKQYHRLYL